MTVINKTNSGVYIMYFNEIDNKYYIGCSTRLTHRKAEHIRLLKGKYHFNKKLQEAYNIYNNIEFDILEYCSPENIFIRENYWINEFDSVNNGFNIVKGLDKYWVGRKLSKYSIETYKNILFEAAYTDKSAREIANKFNVTLGIVKPLIRLANYGWLEDKYPLEYSILKDKQNKFKNNRNKELPKLVNPLNEIVEVLPNPRQFAKINGLDPSRLSKLLNGVITTYRGYTIHYESNN